MKEYITTSRTRSKNGRKYKAIEREVEKLMVEVKRGSLFGGKPL